MDQSPKATGRMGPDTARLCLAAMRRRGVANGEGLTGGAGRAMSLGLDDDGVRAATGPADKSAEAGAEETGASAAGAGLGAATETGAGASAGMADAAAADAIGKTPLTFP